MHPTASSPNVQPANRPSPEGDARRDVEPRSFAETTRDIEPPSAAAEDPIMAYIGYFAGWFDLGRLAAGRRLSRGGFYAPPDEP